MKKTFFWLLLGITSVSAAASVNHFKPESWRPAQKLMCPAASTLIDGPSRATFIRDLNALFSALERGSVSLIDKYAYPAMSKEELSELPSVIERGEISLEGIKVLEEEGAFGSLEEIWPHKFRRWLGSPGPQSADRCYAMRHGGAEAAGLWNGSHFEFFRIDDIGKLND